MKRPNQLCKYLFIGLFVATLAACGEIDVGDSTSGTKAADTDTSPAAGVATVLSGTVADGYLRGAKVFLDRNRNRLYDNGEPMALSTAGGAFSLEVNAGEGDLYPIVVEVVAGETIDEDDGLPVPNGYLLEAPVGRWAFVSPLTSLVKAEQDKNPSFTELQAVLSVRSTLGIDDSVSPFNDYLAHGTGGTLAESVQMATEYSRAHKASRVVAAVQGTLREEIIQNLGGQLDDSDQDAVAYLLSDKVMQQAAIIKQALDDERNDIQPIDIMALIISVETAVDPATLDADLLALYEQRISQEMPTWDMQAPELQSQTPRDGDTASINATVEMYFDELLDETLISSDLIFFREPNGQVFGAVNYDAEQKRLSFVPDQLLLPFTTYQVTLNKALSDILGNPLSEDINWSFTTIFDQTPPPLPDF